MSGGDDWKPGDHGIIVREGLIECAEGRRTGKSSPPRGAVREVAQVAPTVLTNGMQCGCLDLGFTDGSAAVSQRVRKIAPHTPDAEDAETIALMTGKPVKEPRHA